MKYLLCFFIGFVIGILIILPRKFKERNSIEKEIMEKNHVIQHELKELNKHKDILKDDISNLNNNKNILENDISHLSFQKQGLIDDIQKQKISNEEYLHTQEKLLNARNEKIQEYYLNQQEEYKKEYLQILQDYVYDFQQQQKDQEHKAEEINQNINMLNDLMGRLRSAASAAVEANKRNLANQQQQDFYRLQLDDNDILEIKRLREIIPYLKDKEALNKVIYKVYYEKPYSDLIGRVIGQNKKTGIYKITNVTNGMCYVGQAVDIADRWKQHIRRGVGADAPTNNKLYPIMYKLGPENFTFEIVEECDRVSLNEREDYWQEFFHAKDFGYSIK